MSEHTHGEYEISENQKRYFTPTTEEIRTAYARYTQPSLSDNGELFYGTPAEFDRWLLQERHRVAEMAIKKERRRAMSIIMTNIGQIVWQARHNPEGQAIDTSKMIKEILGETDD